MHEKKIIPTIFSLDVETFEKKLNLLKFAPEIHLDFMDGQFTEKSSVSISDMSSIMKFSDKKFQIHLMAKNPIQYLNAIKLLPISCVLIQEEVFETLDDLGNCIHQFKDNDLEVFIVLNPNTNFDRVSNFYDLIDGIMLMSVFPGAEGQSFIENTYNKILEIKGIIGDSFPIQIDGGVSDLNVKKLSEVGANYLCVGSYISSSDESFTHYQKLVNLIK